MGCRVLDGGADGAVLYCSTSMTAFGPVFSSAEHAEDFLKWLPCDPRMLEEPDLQTKFLEWHDARCDDGGDLKEEPDDDDSAG